MKRYTGFSLIFISYTVISRMKKGVYRRRDIAMRGCSRKPGRRLNSLSAEWISMALVHAHLIPPGAGSTAEEAVEAVPLPGNTPGKTA